MSDSVTYQQGGLWLHCKILKASHLVPSKLT